jgi:hypothetical protein
LFVVARDPLRAAQHAADHLTNWLERRSTAPPGQTPNALALARAPDALTALPMVGDIALKLRSAPERGRTNKNTPAHTDWLYHQLAVTGPTADLDAFRRAAAGAGAIPWHLDLDRMEEDFFLRLMAPPAGQARTLSLQGARLLAAALRAAVARRHALAVARVGRSAACCFDLHALVPVPGEVLRLGPDHPDALHWLWAHWGTTEALRHVTLRSGGSESAFRVSFWAADWTPWRALETIRVAWPALHFDVRPVYDLR